MNKQIIDSEYVWHNQAFVPMCPPSYSFEAQYNLPFRNNKCSVAMMVSLGGLFLVEKEGSVT